MVQVFVDYFKDLFTSTNLDDMISVLDFISCRLTDEIKVELDSDLLLKKVKATMEHMLIGKSSGPNGLSVTFYKRH